MDKLAEQIIVDILKTYMELEDNQVWVRFQNQLIPPEEGIFIVVGMVDSQVLSVTNSPVATYDGMSEILQSVMRENIQIDILSRDNTALFRRAEVLLALRSQYSQQQQEAEQFMIARIPTTFVNSSAAEGGSNINRFSIIIACHTWYKQEKVLQSPNDYYNDFNTRVDDEVSIDQPDGIIEFNIREE